MKKASGNTVLGAKPNALFVTYSLTDNPHFKALRSIFFLFSGVNLISSLCILLILSILLDF